MLDHICLSTAQPKIVVAAESHRLKGCEQAYGGGQRVDEMKVTTSERANRNIERRERECACVLVGEKVSLCGDRHCVQLTACVVGLVNTSEHSSSTACQPEEARNFSTAAHSATRVRFRPHGKCCSLLEQCRSPCARCVT